MITIILRTNVQLGSKVILLYSKGIKLSKVEHVVWILGSVCCSRGVGWGQGVQVHFSTRVVCPTEAKLEPCIPVEIQNFQIKGGFEKPDFYCRKYSLKRLITKTSRVNCFVLLSTAFQHRPIDFFCSFFLKHDKRVERNKYLYLCRKK